MSQEQSAAPLVVVTFAKCIVAMNSHTGQRVWEHQTGFKSHYQFMRVDQGRVFVVAKGKLLCLSYLTGTLLWSAEPPLGVGSEPNLLIYAGCVMVADVGEVACFAMQDGSLLWQVKALVTQPARLSESG